jgi:hypothetical protein
MIGVPHVRHNGVMISIIVRNTLCGRILASKLEPNVLGISCTGMHEPALSRVRFGTSRLVSIGWVISHSPAPAPQQSFFRTWFNRLIF